MSKALNKQTNVTVSLPPQHYSHQNENSIAPLASGKKQHPMSRDQVIYSNGNSAQNTIQNAPNGNNYHHRIGNALIHQTYTQDVATNSAQNKKSSLRRKKAVVNSTSKKSVPKSILLSMNHHAKGREQSPPEVFNVISQFNGGNFAQQQHGNFTHRQSIDNHVIFGGLLNPSSSNKKGEQIPSSRDSKYKQLAYQKRDSSIGVKSSLSNQKKVGAQSASKVLRPVSSKQTVHHNKGAQSHYNQSVVYPQVSYPQTSVVTSVNLLTRPSTNVKSKPIRADYITGISPPQSQAKKVNKGVFQESPIVRRQLLLSNASAHKKALNVKELDQSPPSLNYNHNYYHLPNNSEPRIQPFSSRDCSPGIGVIASEVSQAKKQTVTNGGGGGGHQKFLRQTGSVTKPQLQTPMKSQQALSMPATGNSNYHQHQSQTAKAKLSRQIMAGAGTFEMQIKRQKVSMASPLPKKKIQKAPLSTVPKKTSKSKLTSAQNGSCVSKMSSSTANKPPSTSKFTGATPSQMTIGLLQANKGSPPQTAFSSKFNDLYRVSEEKMGSGGSNGSHFMKQFNPSSYIVTSQFNVKGTTQSDYIPANSQLLPQLNQVSILNNLSSNGSLVSSGSPIINLKTKAALASQNNFTGPPPQAPMSMVDSIHLKSQSHSIINRQVIERSAIVGGLSPHLSTPSAQNVSTSAVLLNKQLSAEDPHRVSEIIMPSKNGIGSKSPQPLADAQSPFSKNSQLSFTKAALDHLLSSTQPQNKVLLNSIFQKLSSESKNQQSPVIAHRFDDSSPTSFEQLRTPAAGVNYPTNPQVSRQSYTKSGRKSSPLTSSSAPPSATSNSKDSSRLPDKQTFLAQNLPFSAQNPLDSPPYNPQQHQQQYQLNYENPFFKPTFTNPMTPIQQQQQHDIRDIASVAVDKENIMILSNHTQKELAQQQQRKVSLKYKGGDENSQGVQVKLLQKTSKKENDENYMPTVVGKQQIGKGIIGGNLVNNGLTMGSSVSIFHQVLSETPLRRKNLANEELNVIFSNAKEPLREINVIANHQILSNPQTMKKGLLDKKQFDVTVGDFQAVISEKTPQPKDKAPQMTKQEGNLHKQLMDGILSTVTQNPFTNHQNFYQTASDHSSYQSLGGARNIWTSNSNSIGEEEHSRKPDTMIILDQKGVHGDDKALFELRRRQREELGSDRSDIISRTNSRQTVVQAEQVGTNKENNSLSVRSHQNQQRDRRIGSSNSYLQEVIKNHNPDLIISSGEKSRGSRLNVKMPNTVIVPNTHYPQFNQNLDNNDKRGHHAALKPVILNPLIYQAENSYTQSVQSSMTSSSCISSNNERGNKQLNNTMADAEDMQRIVEAKLHHIQFEKVFCRSNYRRDDLMAYFIKRHQIQMGLIPLRDDNDSCCSSTDEVLSGMSNFSLEIEMLNKLHVEKNNPNKLSQLPVVIDHLLPDPSLTLYQEEPTENGIRFSKDDRPRIHFKDPITKTRNLVHPNLDQLNQDLFEGSLTQKLKGILPISHHRSNSGGQIVHNAATGLDDYNFHDNDICGRMENKYYESSEQSPQPEYQGTKQSCSCSNGRSGGHMCLRCQRNQAAIIKRKDYYSSNTSSALGGTNSSFSEKPKKCRRRIDKQFTSSGDFNYPAFSGGDLNPTNLQDQQIIDLQDIKVQPFCGWGEEIFSNAGDHHHQPNLDQYLQPAIMQSSSIKPQNVSVDQIQRGLFNHKQAEIDFEGIPEIANLSDHSELLAHLYSKQNMNDLQMRQPYLEAKMKQAQLSKNDIELAYLEQLELQKQLLLKEQQLNSILDADPQNHSSYDMAVRDYKWLHETNNAQQQQDALDQILMMSGPAGLSTELVNHHQQQVLKQARGSSGSYQSNTQDHQWLMRPINNQNVEACESFPEPMQLQFQMTAGNKNLALNSQNSSPLNNIGKAPIKKRNPTVQKPTSLSASQSSNWDSDENKQNINRKMGKLSSSSSSIEQSQNSDKMALALFSNPQVKKNVEESRKLFEGCESIRSGRSLSSQSSTNDEPLYFENTDEALAFMSLLRQQLNLDPYVPQNLMILPGVKTLPFSEVLRDNQLKPSVYEPTAKFDRPIQLEEFDFDRILIDIQNHQDQQLRE